MTHEGKWKNLVFQEVITLQEVSFYYNFKFYNFLTTNLCLYTLSLRITI